jgi:hypothetical protein
MVTCVPARLIAARPNGTTCPDLRNLEGLAVEQFVFQEHHRVGIADRRLQQPLGVRGEYGATTFSPGQWAYHEA